MRVQVLSSVDAAKTVLLTVWQVSQSLGINLRMIDAHLHVVFCLSQALNDSFNGLIDLADTLQFMPQALLAFLLFLRMWIW